jgi:hypothetical protein
MLIEFLEVHDHRKGECSDGLLIRGHMGSGKSEFGRVISRPTNVVVLDGLRGFNRLGVDLVRHVPAWPGLENARISDEPELVTGTSITWSDSGYGPFH